MSGSGDFGARGLLPRGGCEHPAKDVVYVLSEIDQGGTHMLSVHRTEAGACNAGAEHLRKKQPGRSGVFWERDKDGDLSCTLERAWGQDAVTVAAVEVQP